MAGAIFVLNPLLPMMPVDQLGLKLPWDIDTLEWMSQKTLAVRISDPMLLQFGLQTKSRGKASF